MFSYEAFKNIAKLSNILRFGNTFKNTKKEAYFIGHLILRSKMHQLTNLTKILK